MAIPLASKPNVTAPGGDYPFGSIKDDTGSFDGTPVSRVVYDDFHQFFAKLLSLGSVTANNLPENSANTFQYHTALQNIINASILTRATYNGNIDCSGNPNYPVGAVGDFYTVSVAGKIGGASGLLVKVGDAIFCKVINSGGDQATVGTSWFSLQGLMFHSTESTIGFAKIATQALVNAGMDDLEYVTPLKLATLLSNIIVAASPSSMGIMKLYNSLSASNTDGSVSQAGIKAVTDLKANKVQGGWTNLTLLNGWAAVAGVTPAYFVDQIGIVHFKGKLDGSSATGTTIASGLPAPLYNWDKKDDFTSAIMSVGTGGDLSVGSVPASVSLFVLSYPTN